MAIILIAHIPTNPWILWIPARFGFSDATETFVFCSGFASALAFGSTFVDRGWLMGAARIAHRVWQVYWAHVAVLLLTAAMLWAIDAHGWGARDKPYVTEPYVVPLFDQTGEALWGVFTLSYVPGLFDILPMYLVILALVPAVMALHRAGGTPAAAAAVLGVWAAATAAGFAARDGWALAPALAGFDALNLPATRWSEHTWYFNPFGWQLVFFLGFGFGMGWLPAPPVTRGLFRAALAVALLSVPLSWQRLYGGWYLGEGALAEWLGALRAAIEPLWWKTWAGAARVVHFLATAYLAWVLVGPGGARLLAPLPLRAGTAARRMALTAAGAVVALATAPYAYVGDIRAAAPALDAWLLANLPVTGHAAVGWLSLAHVAALAVALWNLAPQPALDWLGGVAWPRAVRIAQRVGSQSLAVFMTSIPLSQLCGLALDHIGRTRFDVAIINIGGVAVLIGAAYIAAWFKAQPWRGAPARRDGDGATVAMARTAAE